MKRTPQRSQKVAMHKFNPKTTLVSFEAEKQRLIFFAGNGNMLASEW